MSDESFIRKLRGFANEYIESKRKSLQAGKPQTQVDGGGSSRSVSFSGQDISRDDLLKIKDIRESGGIITSAYDAKALVRFGTGVEVQTDNEDLKNWITENLPTLELLVLEMGEDATYYPYSVAEVVETRTGEFSHIEHIEPWTMLPKTDKFGDIIGWEQQLSGYGNTQSFDSDEIGHIVLNKSSGRDKTGISDVLQNKEEIETFRSNQRAMREATARLGYPFVHAKAGREGAAQLNDNELRRIRNRLADIGPGETQVTGPDIDIETIESATVDFGAIQERDTRMLSNALGLPIEMLNEGSDGLGSGKPAEARLQLFALQNEAARRRFCDQFKREFLDEILSEYSPFSPESEEYGIHIKSFLDDKSDVAGLIQQVGDYMSANEVREKLDMPPVEDDEIGGSYRPPAEEEAPDDAGGGGLFGSAPSDTDFRSLAEGYPISDRSECDGQVVEGPQGGLRCIPPSESGEGVGSADDIPEGGFSDEELPGVVDDLTPDANAVDDGNVTPESVGAMEQALPDDFDKSAFWEPADDPLPDKGQPLATETGTGVMLDVEVGDEGIEGLIVMTPEGEETIAPSEVTHLFDEDADPTDGDADDVVDESPETSADPDAIREAVSERPDTTEEAAEFVARADSPQDVGASSFEDELAVFGITEEEVIEEGVNVPSFSARGAKSEQQSQEFMEATVEARERGWMDGLEGGLSLPDNNLNLPEGAQGTFKPGVRNFTGEKIRNTDNRKAQININPDSVEEWDGEEKYVPFGPDEASKMEYAVSHEFGHSQHYNNLIEERGATVEEIESDEFQRELQDDMREHKDAIEEEFSALAANNPFEFAADTFSALAVGADVSDEVLEAYDKIGGVSP